MNKKVGRPKEVGSVVSAEIFDIQAIADDAVKGEMEPMVAVNRIFKKANFTQGLLNGIVQERRVSEAHNCSGVDRRRLVAIAMLLLCFGLSSCEPVMASTPEYFNKVVDAIYLAEGGANAKKPFGILSVPCDGYSDCRKIAYNTVRNNWKRWEAKGRPGDYLSFLASKYAPVGASNDPQGLNRNWLSNVRGLLQ